MVIEGGKKTYTVADIEALPPGERAELIDGEMFIMEAPSVTHQRILGELYVQIHAYIKNNKGSCEVVIAPGVYIKDDIHNYVDYGRKLMLYQSAGVREYWILLPFCNIILYRALCIKALCPLI